jgi:hypothetical protein
LLADVIEADHGNLIWERIVVAVSRLCGARTEA